MKTISSLLLFINSDLQTAMTTALLIQTAVRSYNGFCDIICLYNLQPYNSLELILTPGLLLLDMTLVTNRGKHFNTRYSRR